MAEKFEFQNKENEAEDVTKNALQEESMAAREQMSRPENCEAADATCAVDASDSTFEEVAESLRSIANRIAELPDYIRREFLSSIEGMTGENFPAYDALRNAMKA